MLEYWELWNNGFWENRSLVYWQKSKPQQLLVNSMSCRISEMENYILAYHIGKNAFNAEYCWVLFSKSALGKKGNSD